MENIASSSSSSSASTTNDIVDSSSSRSVPPMKKAPSNDSASASSDRPMANMQFSKSPCMVPPSNVTANSWCHGGYQRSSLSQPYQQPYRRPAAIPPPPPPPGPSQPFIDYYNSVFTCIYVPTLPPVYPNTLPPPVPFCPSIDLMMNILKQIEYYFSEDNLARDVYLKSKMDEEGWVPVELIASFNRVSQLTNDHQFILDVMRFSYIVEIHDRKMRRFGNWKKWLLPAEFFNRK